MKIGRDLPHVASAIKRDDSRCVACGFDLKCALTVHHAVPRAYGGVDEDSNLTTLCANCHKVVHWLSVANRLDRREAQLARQSLSPAAYGKIRTLAETIRRHCHDARQSGNRWIARADTSNAPLPLDEALTLVAHRNKLNDLDAHSLKQVTAIVLSHIPEDVRRDCAFRIPRGELFFGVTIGNIALFRTPGYEDGAKRALDALFIIWPLNVRLSVITEEEWNEMDRTVGFATIPCLNLELNFEEALALEDSDWKAFGQACRDAAGVSRARPRMSNVLVDESSGTVG